MSPPVPSTAGIPTSTQVARASGVSQTCVSMIFNGKTSRFRPETVQRVLETARRLGYRPNTSAQSMRTGRFGAVGLLASKTPEGTRLPQAAPWLLADEARRRNLHLIIGQVDDAKLASHADLPMILRAWSVDGLLLSHAYNISPAALELVNHLRIPTVFLNTRLPHDSVHPNDFAAAGAATRHLLALGHRRIAYPTHFWQVDDHYSRVDRREGYAAAMQEAGHKPLIFRSPAGSQERDRPRLIRQWLTARNRPTAIITYQLQTSLLWYFEARHFGLEIPRDLSIMTFGQSTGLNLGVRFSLMLEPAEKLAAAALDMLARKIDAPAEPISSIAVDFTLFPGETVAPPPVS